MGKIDSDYAAVNNQAGIYAEHLNAPEQHTYDQNKTSSRFASAAGFVAFTVV